MKSLRLTAVAATLALAALTGVGPANADTPTAAGLLQAGARQGVADGYPGVIGLVRQGDTTQYVHAGVGDRNSQAPADPKAQFRIGSNSKALTAAILLQLESEQRLSLDDTVATWLPGAVNANGYDGTKITIRELLNHTSGLPDYAKDYGFSLSYALDTQPYQAWSPQTLVNLALTQHQPTSAPGRQWSYANTNYVLAGMVIKAVTGNDAATEIQHRIIEPLGLHDTTFPTADPTLHGNYLHGYEYPGGFSFAIMDVTVSDVQAYGSAGAIVSTLDDLATFSRALLAGKLLPPAQEAELKTTVPTGEGTSGYGLGIDHMQLPCGQWAWTHDGAVLGYYSDWFGSDDGTKQVVRANNEYHMLTPTRGLTDTVGATVNAYCALQP
ncbi:serine hydrolase domain-containing protein [Kitasatospora sp. MAP5-34]|uniref:serine hydrolase domain-containing protein n=1 Tax=Kitasatospora sp. MAP5-34 TaxID=3035102 RepID=UPI002475227F|nr:serine hydrolase domain-containing protein [Kitasatospora sp. MAP5-34]MDH6579164.1 D-alanyl-D-alanine carboxypeptidase [Kitasatospora sp. MAP5-34]